MQGVRIFLAILLLTHYVSLFAQNPQPINPKSDGLKPNLTNSKENNVQLVKELASRASQLQSVKRDERIDTLSDLADILWQYDSAYAGQLFDKAIGLLDTEPEPNGSGSPTGSRSTRNNSQDSIRLVAARARLLGRLNKHDPARGKKLRDKIIAEAQSSNRETTGTQSTGGDATTGNTSIKGKALGIVTYALGLRPKNAALADQVFLRALSELSVQPEVDGDDLLTLGTYLFGGSADSTGSGNESGFPSVIINNVRVANLSTDKAGINISVVQAYLVTASGILNRTVTDPQQQVLYYIAAYQLLPKASRFSPELVPLFTATIRRLGPAIPPQFSDDAAYDGLSGKGTPQDPNEELARVEKIGNASERQQRYLEIAYKAHSKMDFPLARRAAEKIDDSEARVVLNRVIKFGETTQLLDQKNFDLVEGRLNNLEANIEDATICLKVARAYMDEGKKEKALEWIHKGLDTARRIHEPRQPFLFLAAMDLISNYDPAAATSVLAESVQAFNSRFGALQFSDIQWTESIKAGQRSIRFRLNVKDLNFSSFTKALRIVAKSDPETTKAMVLGLKNESILNLAIAGLAHGLLS
jgi:hypothetical protein